MSRSQRPSFRVPSPAPHCPFEQPSGLRLVVRAAKRFSFTGLLTAAPFLVACSEASAPADETSEHSAGGADGGAMAEASGSGGNASGGSGSSPDESDPWEPKPWVPPEVVETIPGCDCGSTDPARPCTGTTIDVTIPGDPDHSLTWTFESEGASPYCGRFATGDYWVAPVDGSNLSLVEVAASGPLSIDLDPQPEKTGIGWGKYDNKSDAEDLAQHLPAELPDPASLVAAIQRDEGEDGKCGTKAIEGECVDVYDVLTVLDVRPPDGGASVLRPPITTTEKPLIRFDGLDLERLPRVEHFDGTDAAGLAAIRRRWAHSVEVFDLQIPHLKPGHNGEGGRAFRSHAQISDYAADVAARWFADLAIVLSSEHDREEIRGALAGLLSMGVDLIYAIREGPEDTIRGWGSGAGQSGGKIGPAALFAALHRDPSWAEWLATQSTSPLAPQELRQVRVGRGSTPVWGDQVGDYDSHERRYWASLYARQCYDGAPGSCENGGKKTLADPYGYIDGPENAPGTNYMNVTLGTKQALAGLMHLMPEVCAAIEYPPLITYVDRVLEKGVHTDPDPCAAPDPGESDDCNVWNNQDACDYYGVTWGPDPSVEGSWESPGDCIHREEGAPARYASRHGNDVAIGRRVASFADHWQVIRGAATACSP